MFEGDLLLLQTEGWPHINSELYPKLPGPPLSLGNAGRGSLGELLDEKRPHTGSKATRVPEVQGGWGHCSG